MTTIQEEAAPLRTLAITQNITVDGSIEMLGDWFDPQGQAGADSSDLLDELHRQDREADGLLLGRRTFEDLRGYWPKQSDDATGIADYLNQVQKYVVSSTMTEPEWKNSTILSGDAVEEVAGTEGDAGPRRVRVAKARAARKQGVRQRNHVLALRRRLIPAEPAPGVPQAPPDSDAVVTSVVTDRALARPPTVGLPRELPGALGVGSAGMIVLVSRRDNAPE